MSYVYNIIKESNLNLELLESSKDEIKTDKEYKAFSGNTHKDFKDYGQANHIKLGLSSSFGYTKTKNGESYWVLPYPINEVLNVERTVKGELVSKTYTKEELNNFGFDEPEELI